MNGSVVFIVHHSTGDLRRMLKRVIQHRRRVKAAGVPLGYVEDFDEPRTQLGAWFSILTGQP